MAKKYINITDLEYKDGILKACNPTDRTQIYLNGVLDFFKVVGPKISLSVLEMYKTQKYTRISDIGNEDEEMQYYDLSDRKQIYLNGILDFLKFIGSIQIKTTLYGFTNDVDLFETLDEVDSQIKKVFLSMCDGEIVLNYLSQSDQPKYLEEVRVLDRSIDSIYLLKDMMVLATITIHIQDRDFCNVIWLTV
ncbi:hypothetical protein K501DRAFT_276228 [Backusella circina FSU 941]|nr:hypothetical protein K501DRAFT_276228 [Backusella circina FSU 941]